jgi:hypothetical protein
MEPLFRYTSAPILKPGYQLLSWHSAGFREQVHKILEPLGILVQTSSHALAAEPGAIVIEGKGEGRARGAPEDR